VSKTNHKINCHQGISLQGPYEEEEQKNIEAESEANVKQLNTRDYGDKLRSILAD